MKRTYTSLVGILTLCVFLLHSCAEAEYFSQPQVEQGTPEFIVYDDNGEPLSELQIPRDAAQTSFNVTSNSDWTAKATDSWLTVNPVSDYGDGRILLKAEYNSGVNDRSTTIEINLNGEIKSIPVHQDGAPLLSSSKAEAGMFRTEYSLEVAALGDWSAAVAGSEGSWCHLSQTSGTEGITTLTVTLDRNTTGVLRNAVVEFQHQGETETFEIAQRGTIEPFTPVLAEVEDTLRLNWNGIFGVRGYKITVLSDNDDTVLAESDPIIDTASREYTFLPDKSNNLFAGLGVRNVRVKIEAVTDDPDYPLESEPMVTNTMFDVTSGDGSSASSPYVITTRRHLHNVREAPDKYFLQGADIDLAGFNDDGVAENGNFTSITGTFSGTYDGNDKSIDNLTMIYSTDSYGGMFSEVSGTITKVHLKNPLVNIAGTGSVGSAALIGALSGTASYCTVEGGSVTRTENNRHGGLIGETTNSNALITYCDNIGTKVDATGLSNIGGVCGYLNKGSMSYCTNSGTVIAGQQVGGITGGIGEKSITYCSNSGEVIGEKNVAGISGRTFNNAKAYIQYCYNTGTITANGESAAGITHMTTGTGYVMDCYNTGKISSQTFAGGIVGQISNASKADMVTRCYNIGEIVSATVNAIVGVIQKDSSPAISGCYYLNTLQVGTQDGATARSAEEMQNMSNYLDWDPAEWQISAESSYLYPQFVKFPHK